MQMNQINPTGYHVCNRILSFFLAFIMMISSVSFPEMIVSAEDELDTTGGFKLALSWNSDDTNDEKESPSEIYRYESDKEEDRIITLKVEYENKEVSKSSYAPNTIVITVSGLKDAVRSETSSSYIPIGVAADKVSDANKLHDWSYSYTQKTDTYTFINNNVSSTVKKRYRKNRQNLL